MQRRVMGLGTGIAACLVAALLVPTGAATAEIDAPVGAVAAAGEAPTPSGDRAKPRVMTTGGSQFTVRVTPALSDVGSWHFTLQRRTGTKWKTIGDYSTRGDREEVTLPLRAGRYRVLVPAQHGYAAVTSSPMRYQPTPQISLTGSGGLEVQVSPARTWKMILERKTAQGWTRVDAGIVRGSHPTVFAEPSGTYRVRTKATGRFPAFTGRPFDYAAAAPAGPIAPALLDEVFAAPAPAAANAKPQASTDCGKVMKEGGIALGLLSFIPYAGPVFKVIGLGVRADGKKAGSACVQAEFAQANEQLAFQEGQIAALQEQLTEVQNEIIDLAYVEKLDDETQWAYEYREDLDRIQEDFANFMEDGKFWSGTDSQGAGLTIADASVAGTAASPAFATLQSFVTGNQTDFQDYVENLSATSVTCGGSLLPPVGGDTCVESKSLKVTLDTNKVTYDAYSSMEGVLTTQIPVTLVDSSTNVVPLFDQYNDSLVSFYQQSLGALQLAYQMEYLVNQLNYENGAAFTTGQTSTVDQIEHLGGVGGTWYGYLDLQSTLGSAPTAEQQIDIYNRAQKSLSHVYAARINQLYRTTVGFIVSDDLIAPQAYPTGGYNDKLDYGTYVGNYGTRPLEMLPSVATASHTWDDNAVLYQYGGLRDAVGCATALKAYNVVNGVDGSLYGADGAINDTTCPALLTTASGALLSAPPSDDPSVAGGPLTDCESYASAANTGGGSCYDGNTLAAFTNRSGGITRSSTVLNNLLLCNYQDPNLKWFQVDGARAANAAGLRAGDYALTCGNWGKDANYDFPQSTPPDVLSGLDAQGNAVTPRWKDSLTLESNFGMQVAFSTQWYSDTNGNSHPNNFGSNSYSISEGYYYPLAAQTSTETWQLHSCDKSCQTTTASGWWTYYNPASTTPPLNLGGPKDKGKVNFPKATDGSCSIVKSWASSQVTVDTAACTVTFPTIGVSSYPNDADTAGVTIGLALPNAATGSAAGGFVLPVTLVAARGWAGKQYETSTSPQQTYCDGNCLLLAMYVSAGTHVPEVGYAAPPATVSCEAPRNGPGGSGVYVGSVGWTTCSGIFSSQGSVTVADGGQFQFNVGRINDGVAQIDVIPVG